MIPAERELFRHSILRHLEASTRFGSTLPELRNYLRISGFSRCKDTEITAELQYLIDKNFVTLVPKEISPENQAWRITAAGRDFLATRGGDDE